MTVLTAIDIMGIQQFIFSSNRLRDVVTGSLMVDWSTSFVGALTDLVPKENILLAGGGNSLIEFDSIDEAREFSAQYTRRLYEQTPGLEVAIVHKPFEKGGLARAIQEIQIELARTKTARLPTSPLLGLSITAPCQETGLPATDFDQNEPTVPLSRGVLKRRQKKYEANRHWFEYLDGREGFAFPLDLDQLGRTMGDTSIIGVVHVDGNDVGQKIKNWLSEKVEKGVDDDILRREYREWSQGIDKLGKSAFRAIMDRIWGAIEKVIKDGKESMKITGKPTALGFDLKKADGDWMLPLRPILVGGDELTFVCDGRVALDLAETAITVFDKSNVSHLGKVSACAGVTLVRVHAPIARAYALAEALCRSAKWKLKEKGNDGECALDWHIGSSRPGETVTGIRERQYKSNGYRLTCRPYLLDAIKHKAETWRWLSRTLLDDSKAGLRGNSWSERRNKVKAFSELVREGPDGVKATLAAWRVVDKNLQLPQGIEEDGFFAKSRTPLLDALELLDVHLVLNLSSNN